MDDKTLIKATVRIAESLKGSGAPLDLDWFFYPEYRQADNSIYLVAVKYKGEHAVNRFDFAVASISEVSKNIDDSKYIFHAIEGLTDEQESLIERGTADYPNIELIK